MEPIDETAAITRELLDEYGEIAVRLSADCNIPNEHFIDLLRTLEQARLTLEDAEYESSRTGSIRSHLKTRKDFAKAAVRHRQAWAVLDVDAKVTVRRAVESRYPRAFVEPAVVHPAPGFEVAGVERLVTVDQFIEAIAEASSSVADLARTRRGRPSDDTLKACVRPLKEFWEVALGRPFYEHFQENFGASDDPDRGSLVPANDVSRFVVEAVQALVGREIPAATCQWTMRHLRTTPE